MRRHLKDGESLEATRDYMCRVFIDGVASDDVTYLRRQGNSVSVKGFVRNGEGVFFVADGGELERYSAVYESSRVEVDVPE